MKQTDANPYWPDNKEAYVKAMAAEADPPPIIKLHRPEDAEAETLPIMPRAYRPDPEAPLDDERRD